MGWREVIGNLLEKFDSSPQRRVIEDPFNCALSLSLDTSPSPHLLEQLRTNFPALSKPAAQSLLEKCDVLIHQSIIAYYRVRDGELTEQEAEAQIKLAAPEIDAPNFSLLRVRCHMVVSK